MKEHAKAIKRVVWFVLFWMAVAGLVRFHDADCINRTSQCATEVGKWIRDVAALRWGKDHILHEYQTLFAGILAFGGGYWVLQAAIVQAATASKLADQELARASQNTSIDNERLRIKRFSELNGLAKQTMLSVQELTHHLDQADVETPTRINEAAERLLRQCERLVLENPDLAVWTQKTALEAVRFRLKSLKGEGSDQIGTNGRILREALAKFYDRPERLADAATLTIRIVKSSPPPSLGEDKVLAEALIPSFNRFFG